MSLIELLADPSAARRALDESEVSVAELARAALSQAEELQPAIGAFAELTPELALLQAERAQAALDGGGRIGPLHGLPVAVKDVIDVAGVPTRLGTPGGGHRSPLEDAPVVSLLTRAGAVVVGKTATHELALGMITPQARNPRDPTRITGGSSGGSAAAVAAGIVPVALGTDTNGSLRAPAAHCGVVGFKPTRGVVPTGGVSPLASTQDTVGLIASTVTAAVDGWRTLSPGPPAAAAPTAMRLGFDRAVCARADKAVARAVEHAAERLAEAGAVLVDVQLPDLDLVRAASLLAILREANTAWEAPVNAHPEGFGPEVRAAIRAARAVTDDAYDDAKRVRLLACSAMRELYAAAALDAVLMPSVPVTATAAGAERVTVHGRPRSVEALQSENTALASLTGQPALSLPCGTDAEAMPIGLQVLGRAGRDGELLALAMRVEHLLSDSPYSYNV